MCRRATCSIVANAGDGSLRLFHGEIYSDAGRVDLGDDADNIRVDRSSRSVSVGYGAGALAVIDPAARKKIAEIPLRAHPESFQIDARTGRAYVNVPNAHMIAVLDLSSASQVGTWATGGLSSNFPMALDDETKRVLAMFRSPPKLGVFDMRDGSSAATVDACADADDIFVDAKRHRIYVSCGAGAIDVLDAQTYQRVVRIPTAAGARTSLYVPELDQLLRGCPRRQQPGSDLGLSTDALRGRDHASLPRSTLYGYMGLFNVAPGDHEPSDSRASLSVR